MALVTIIWHIHFPPGRDMGLLLTRRREKESHGQPCFYLLILNSFAFSNRTVVLDICLWKYDLLNMGHFVESQLANVAHISDYMLPDHFAGSHLSIHNRLITIYGLTCQDKIQPIQQDIITSWCLWLWQHAYPISKAIPKPQINLFYFYWGSLSNSST